MSSSRSSSSGDGPALPPAPAMTRKRELGKKEESRMEEEHGTEHVGPMSRTILIYMMTENVTVMI